MTNRTRARARCGTGPVAPRLSAADELAREAFANFLAWGIRPNHQDVPVPPAVWAYRFGASGWCPPPGVW